MLVVPWLLVHEFEIGYWLWLSWAELFDNVEAKRKSWFLFEYIVVRMFHCVHLS